MVIITWKLVAKQFDISRRQVQQLAKEYRKTGAFPTIETPGRDPFAGYPDDILDRILAVHHTLGGGPVAVGHVLAFRDGISIDHNRVHIILKGHEHVN